MAAGTDAMSSVGRGGKPVYRRMSVSMSVERQADVAGARAFQQIYRTGVSDEPDDFAQSNFSPAAPIVNSVLGCLNVGAAGVVWDGEERCWQCRLVNGVCSGLLIDACKTAKNVTHITLTAPSEVIYLHLVEMLTEMTQRMAVFGDVEIKVRHGHSE